VPNSDGFTPALQKPKGFRVKASEGEVVVFYFDPSATQNLKFSGFPAGVYAAVARILFISSLLALTHSTLFSIFAPTLGFMLLK
jgi:hypothetical protein